jgi:hypothetical protein
VLLPASTIDLQTSWILPSNIRLVGEGGATILEDYCSGSDPGPYTCGFSSSYLIVMGSPRCSGTPPTCSGISVERLKLQRNITKNSTQSFRGILNEYGTQSSYANEVTMSDLMGTGLLIEPDGSGPYTNIYYLAASTVCSGPSNSRCVDFEGQTLRTAWNHLHRR